MYRLKLFQDNHVLIVPKLYFHKYNQVVKENLNDIVLYMVFDQIQIYSEPGKFKLQPSLVTLTLLTSNLGKGINPSPPPHLLIETPQVYMK